MFQLKINDSFFSVFFFYCFIFINVSLFVYLLYARSNLSLDSIYTRKRFLSFISCCSYFMKKKRIIINIKMITKKKESKKIKVIRYTIGDKYSLSLPYFFFVFFNCYSFGIKRIYFIF